MSDTGPHHRRSIRLPFYDYGQNGAYFVTVCAAKRRCVFGAVDSDQVRLSTLGRIVAEEWLRTPDIRTGVAIDVIVVMPNHTHAVVVLMNENSQPEEDSPGSFASPRRTLGSIVRGFKASVTTRWNTYCGSPGSRIWQRGYYEHVIRNDESLAEIREYIQGNPVRWMEDEENPRNWAIRRSV